LEIVARRHRRGQAIGAWAVRPAAAGAGNASAFEAARAAIDLPAGGPVMNERRRSTLTLSGITGCGLAAVETAAADDAPIAAVFRGADAARAAW